MPLLTSSKLSEFMTSPTPRFDLRYQSVLWRAPMRRGFEGTIGRVAQKVHPGTRNGSQLATAFIPTMEPKKTVLSVRLHPIAVVGTRLRALCLREGIRSWDSQKDLPIRSVAGQRGQVLFNAMRILRPLCRPLQAGDSPQVAFGTSLT